MTAGIHEFICEQGATFQQTIIYQDSDENAIDLTNYTARMKAKDTFGGTELLSIDTDSEIVITGGSGQLVITIPAETTAGYTAGNYIYDLEIVSSGGVVSRILQGDFIVRPEVTD